MGGFCVQRCGSSGRYCSLISPNLSVTDNIELSFIKHNDIVQGGSCGDVLYFFDLRGRTFIYNNLDKSKIYVFPPEALTPINFGWYRSCGVCYDAKSEEYKVLRIYSQLVVNEAMEEVSKLYFDLYSVLTQSAKYVTEPTRKCSVLDTSIYVGEAGSGSGSCYFLAYLSDDDASSPLMEHVLSFDFATESFDQFPLPATAKVKSPSFQLVEYRGLLGALAYWNPPDEFSLDPRQSSSDLSVQLFLRNGKGTSWDLLYDVSVADAYRYRPLGLRDRLLFVAASPRDGCCELMVYNLASGMLKKLGINNCKMSGFSYGEGRKKKKKNNKGKGKGKGKGKEKGK